MSLLLIKYFVIWQRQVIRCFYTLKGKNQYRKREKNTLGTKYYLGKLYFLAKIHKRLYNVPGRSAISNCETFTKKTSEFLY